MGSFHAHRVRFFEYQPKSIHCLAYQGKQRRLALSRSDGSIEIYSIDNRWFQEKVIILDEESSVESLLWCDTRLFSAGLQGDLVEYDLALVTAKSSVSSNNGAIWCLAKHEPNQQIAAGTENGCIVIFQITSEGAEYHRSLDRHQGRILSLSWYYGADVEPVFISSGIDVIRVWSIETGHVLRRMTLARKVHQQETIIWAITVTSDLTVISGDSRGITSFWNGKQGTLIKEYQSHEADVLTLALTNSHKSVIAAGVDPTIVQFDFVPLGGDSAGHGWVIGSSSSPHSHDVRAAVLMNNRLITAGVDCHLAISILNTDKAVPPLLCISPIPQRALVHTAKLVNCILLQYTNFVQLWRLGSTDQQNGKANELLQLSSGPLKLLELKCRSGELMVCSAISSDAHWLAYSDQSTVRMFRLISTDITSGHVDIAIEKCHDLKTIPARCLAFTASGLLVSLTCSSSLQLIDSGHIIATIAPATDVSRGAHLLAVSPSGTMAMVADHLTNVNVYDLENKQHRCTLPHYKYQATALTFDPTSSIVAIAYADNMIIEYNLLDMAYTKWSRQFLFHRNEQWKRRHNVIVHIAYHPHCDKYLFVADSHMFCLMNKTQHFPSKSEVLFHKPYTDDVHRKVRHAFHVYTKAKYLLHFDVLDDGSLLLVERPSSAIYSVLPPVLKVKKYGT